MSIITYKVIKICNTCDHVDNKEDKIDMEVDRDIILHFDHHYDDITSQAAVRAEDEVTSKLCECGGIMEVSGVEID